MKHHLAEELRDEPAYGASHSCHSGDSMVGNPVTGSVGREIPRRSNSSMGALDTDSSRRCPLSGQELLQFAALVCNDTKGKDITALDVRGLSDMSDYLLVVSGRSDRQVQGLCNRIIDGFSAMGISPNSIEGLDKGHWVVLDFADVIIHVFYEPARAHYDIESLWAKAPRLDSILAEVIAA